LPRVARTRMRNGRLERTLTAKVTAVAAEVKAGDALLAARLGRWPAAPWPKHWYATS
jgi:hypothetical protein